MITIKDVHKIYNPKSISEDISLAVISSYKKQAVLQFAPQCDIISAITNTQKNGGM